MVDPGGAYTHRPEEGELRWMGETSTRFLAAGDDTGGAFCLVDERANRGESVPLHRHPEDMESFYVLEGELTIYIGEGEGSQIKQASSDYGIEFVGPLPDPVE
jgi:quercetin dioxygenase-like cupin family protein